MTPTLESRLIAAHEALLRYGETTHSATIDEVYGILSHAYQQAARLDGDLTLLRTRSDQLACDLNMRKGEES